MLHESAGELGRLPSTSGRRRRMRRVVGRANGRGSGGLEHLVQELAAEIGGVVVLISARRSGPGWALDRLEHAGLRAPALFTSKLRACLSRARGAYADFDADAPPPSERNRVTTREIIARRTTLEKLPLHRDVFRPTKLGALDFSRVVVCDGERPLAVLYAFGDEGSSRRTRKKIAAAVPGLHTRLMLAARVDEVDLARAALALTLDALPGEAWILDEAGEVSLANDAARRRIDEEGNAMTTRLARAIQGSSSGLRTRTTMECAGLRVSRIRVDTKRQWFLVRAPLAAASTESAVAVASHRWGLTAKQTRVLGLLSRGHANKVIATELGCAENTIEYHVTRLLAKAQAESRAELIARLFATTSA